MNQSNIPNFPGMGAMTDTLEFVKNFWGSMGVPGTTATGGMPGMPGMPGMQGMGMPGMVVPTLSVDEIRKKITDLKAVESWLELNMNMLRASIQALEVQAATISTLQSMGEALSATMNAGAAPARPAAPQPPSQSVFQTASQPEPQATPQSTVPPPKAAHKAADAPEPSSEDQADAANLTAPLVNAAAWWNMLQDQFKQAVNTAITADAPATGNGADRAPAKKRKPSASKSAASTTRRRKPAK